MHLSGQKTARDTLLWALSPLVNSAVTPKIAANPELSTKTKTKKKKKTRIKTKTKTMIKTNWLAVQ